MSVRRSTVRCVFGHHGGAPILLGAPKPSVEGEAWRVRLLGIDDPGWATFLDHTDHDVYHTPEWAELEAQHEAGTPCALLVEQSDRWLMVPLILRPAGEAGVDATSPYGFSGPLVRGVPEPGFVGEALRAGCEALRDEGVITLFLRWHPLLSPEPPSGFGAVARHGETVAVDLSRPMEELYGQMRRNHRVQIRQALTAGYVARWDTSDAGLAAFRSLYRRTMERVHAASFYRFDDAYFASLATGLGERVRLAFVEAEGAVVAAGVFTESCSGIVEAHLTASDGPSSTVCARATKLMLAWVIERCKASGQRWLHLGGGHTADDSLMHFKAGFSPLRFPFLTTRVVIRRVEYARLVADVAPAADPEDLTGYFPAYRRPDVGRRSDPPGVSGSHQAQARRPIS